MSAPTETVAPAPEVKPEETVAPATEATPTEPKPEEAAPATVSSIKPGYFFFCSDDSDQEAPKEEVKAEV